MSNQESIIESENLNTKKEKSHLKTRTIDNKMNDNNNNENASKTNKSHMEVSCSICKKKIKKILIKKHMTYHKDNILKRNYKVCPICVTPLSHAGWYRHIRTVHNTEPPKKQPVVRPKKTPEKPKRKYVRKKPLKEKPVKEKLPRKVYTRKPEVVQKIEKQRVERTDKLKEKKEARIKQLAENKKVQKERLRLYNQEYKRRVGLVDTKSEYIPRPRQPLLIINGVEETQAERTKRLTRERKRKWLEKKRNNNN